MSMSKPGTFIIDIIVMTKLNQNTGAKTELYTEGRVLKLLNDTISRQIILLTYNDYIKLFTENKTLH